MQQKVFSKLLQQAILIYGMTVGNIAQRSVKNQEQPNVLLHRPQHQLLVHSHGRPQLLTLQVM